MGTNVFDGIKVADFTRFGVGPLTTMYLAYYGATVVRIESRMRPDGLRTSPPFKDGKPGIDRSGYFAYFNANKYSIAINLREPKGIETARKLVAWADVVAENYAPGVMERLGLSYEDLKKIKPDIIMLRTSNQGITGPHARQPAFGHHLVGLCGFSHLTGWPDGEPQALGIAYTDILTPRLGAAALVLALDYHRKTGKGQLLDVSQLETSAQFLAPVILDFTVNGRVAKRAGNSCAYAAPHGVYPCLGTDRWCAISVFTDEEWYCFCRVIGNPPWTRHARFTTLSARKANEAELDRLVGEWTVKVPPEEVMRIMQAAGVPAGVVENAEDILQDPQLKQRQAIWMLEHKVIGTAVHPGETFHLSQTPAVPKMSAPCLGEHTEYVCKELLKMSDEEFDELLVTGIFE